jgi:hypothetical protein
MAGSFNRSDPLEPSSQRDLVQDPTKAEELSHPTAEFTDRTLKPNNP